jgi:hypothetical protein
MHKKFRHDDSTERALPTPPDVLATERREAHLALLEGDGYVVHVEEADDSLDLGWFPGTVAEAIASARRKWPGCRILMTYELTGYDYRRAIES